MSKKSSVKPTEAEVVVKQTPLPPRPNWQMTKQLRFSHSCKTNIKGLNVSCPVHYMISQIAFLNDLSISGIWKSKQTQCAVVIVSIKLKASMRAGLRNSRQRAHPPPWFFISSTEQHCPYPNITCSHTILFSLTLTFQEHLSPVAMVICHNQWPIYPAGCEMFKLCLIWLISMPSAVRTCGLCYPTLMN